MHVLETYDFEGVFDSRKLGSFVIPCLAIYQRSHFVSILKEMSGLLNNNLMVINMENPQESFDDLYKLSVDVHEKRHFHDFIGSPIAYSFFRGSFSNWLIVRGILHLSLDKKIRVNQPAISNPEFLISIVGEEATKELLGTHIYHQFFLNPIPAKKCNESEKANDLNLNITTFDMKPLPTVPAYRTEGLIIPISLCSIIEGSAILSQILWTISSWGPKAAKHFWTRIDDLAWKNSKYEYIVCIRLLLSIFGPKTIADFVSLRAFRTIFRFALSGSLPSPPSMILDFHEEAFEDTPTNRFLLFIRHIVEKRLQKDFLDEPNIVIKEFASKTFPEADTSMKKYKDKIIEYLSLIEADPDPGHYLEKKSFKKLLKFQLKAIDANLEDVDSYLDILWEDEYLPELIEPPIQIFGIDDSDPLIMRICEDDNWSEWINVYLLETLTRQYIYTEDMFCPFSGKRGFCDIASKSRTLIPLETCEDDCIVKSVTSYLGFKL